MSHVWFFSMKTDEAKKTFLDAGLLSVKDRPGLIVDPDGARVQQVEQQMPTTELLMDEEEAERAAVSEAVVHAVATREREMETPKQDTASSRGAAATTPGDARPKTTTTALPRLLTAMDSTGESQTASVRQSEPGLGEEVMDFAAQNRDEAALPGNCNAASTHADADFSAPTETDRTEEGWQISQSLRAKKKQAKERKFQQGGDFSAGSRPTTDNQPKRRGQPARRRLPALPKDDLKVVFRPHQGLPLKNVTTQAISDAIVEACQGKVRWDQFILRIRPGSNIALASTPDTTVAMAMRGVTSSNINGRPHPVNVYVTAASIRFRTQSVTLVDARMLGDSQSAVLTFFGDILPRYVYYRGGEKECIPFRNTVQFCRACGEVGHRTDVCPQPDSPVCHTCGMRNPEVNHNCTPTCAICTGNHITGDRSCLKRLKPIRKQAAKPPKKPHKPAPRWFQSEEEESEWEYGRGGTRKSRSRTRTPSKNHAVETGQPGQRHPKSTSTPRAISQDNPNAQALPRSKPPGACPAHSNPQADASLIQTMCFPPGKEGAFSLKKMGKPDIHFIERNISLSHFSGRLDVLEQLRQTLVEIRQVKREFQRRIRRGPTPLSKEDIKVILRPHKGLTVKNLFGSELSMAVIEACWNSFGGESFLQRVHPGSNIIILSTPHEQVSGRLREINQSKIRGRIHPFNAYVADPEDVLRGIVHGLPPGTTQADLMENLRIRTQGVKIERARMLGSSKSAIITFTGDVLPRKRNADKTRFRHETRSARQNRAHVGAAKASQLRKIAAASRLRRQPTSHFRVVVCPGGGLHVRTCSQLNVTQAILLAARLPQAAAEEDIVCANAMQNVFVISTPSKSNASAYCKVQEILLASKKHTISAYITPPGNTCTGVVRGIDTNLAEAALEIRFVTPRNPMGLGDGRIKETPTVIVLFNGMKAPNYVHCGPSILRCTLYKTQIDTCRNCGRIGHKHDVCHRPTEKAELRIPNFVHEKQQRNHSSELQDQRHVSEKRRANVVIERRLRKLLVNASVLQKGRGQPSSLRSWPARFKRDFQEQSFGHSFKVCD
ncbi:hypothetical protein HPB51_021668 [Rhipicephalus microplus]|uniref:CCHC-type domain-containing protein n=1 Tax=Rhipicephalus microplus TaxID=6941 RepID=A0A9J6E3K8_RHIMP|nr:hypothetical protein HPB51_021668 [Rhipicephalus microplus]